MKVVPPLAHRTTQSFYEVKVHGHAPFRVTPDHLLTVMWRGGPREPYIILADDNNKYERLAVSYSSREALKVATRLMRILRPNANSAARAAAESGVWPDKSSAEPLLIMDDLGFTTDAELLEYGRRLAEGLTTVQCGDVFEVQVRDLANRQGQLWRACDDTHLVQCVTELVPSLASPAELPAFRAMPILTEDELQLYASAAAATAELGAGAACHSFNQMVHRMQDGVFGLRAPVPGVDRPLLSIVLHQPLTVEQEKSAFGDVAFTMVSEQQ